MPERITDSKLKISSRVGKPKLRLMDGVVRYLRIQRWWLVAGGRGSWKKSIRKAEGLGEL